MSDNDSMLFQDALFRNKKGKIIEPPAIEGLVADTHAHLDMLDDPALALARAAAHNVMLVCSVVDPAEDAKLTYDMLAEWLAQASYLLDGWGVAQTLPTCRIIAGVHPHAADKFDADILNMTVACANHPATVAIGEIGLDYHYDFSKRENQRDVFRRQINLAHELRMPVVLHIRDAHDDALAILRDEGVPKEGVLLHCFTSDVETLEPFLELGCSVAFGGALTFANSDAIRESAKRVPLDKLLTETDCPYMAPKPLRSTKSSPDHTIFVADALAEVRGVVESEREAFFAQLFQNALDFFKVQFI